jgi:hypothetical protein
MQPTLSIVTGGDSRYFEFLQGAVLSIHAYRSQKTRVCVLDLGLTDEQRKWIDIKCDSVATPKWHFDFPGREDAPHWLRGLLARPFLPQYFPGSEIYLFIDADAFVLDRSAIELFMTGARNKGMAIVPELDRGNRQHYGKMPAVFDIVYSRYAKHFGQDIAKELRSFPILNAGVFAIHSEAPHWAAWRSSLTQAAQRGADMMTDQTALNYAIYCGNLFHRTEMLPAWCNWGTHMGVPAWDIANDRLVEPFLPHTPIGILHRSGQDKSEVAEVPCISGGSTAVRLRYPARRMVQTFPDGPLLPGDYVSPGLKVVMPDRCFPHLAEGDRGRSDWPHLRREIPHRWYVDRRVPHIGFVSRDEAALLYNTALRFRGHRALEIGCWLGWSTFHIALAGVSLDVLDPALANTAIRKSVEESLRAGGVRGLVQLVAGASPGGVLPLAGGRRWSFFFIDGNHEGPAPLLDAQACAASAEQDAIIMFHDLAAPSVAEALNWLRSQGWRTIVYKTMQIMGAAWRGQVAPIAHSSDPTVDWKVPAHLTEHSEVDV